MDLNLTDKNFLLYAAHHYDNPQCFNLDEFNQDIKRFHYLKKLFSRYSTSGDLKERLILNHLIALYNVFGPLATTRMLFFKLEKFAPLLKPFLVYLGYMPDFIMQAGKVPHNIRSSDIAMDQHIVEKLRGL